MRFPPTSKGITSNGRSSGTDATICLPGIVTVVQLASSPSSREEGMGDGRAWSMGGGLTKINPHALLLDQLPPNLEIGSDVRVIVTHKLL